MKARGLFITGTDTGVGKTYVTSMIARELAERGVRVGASMECLRWLDSTTGGYRV